MAVFAFRLVFLTVFVAMVVGSGFLDTGDQDRYLEYLLRRTLDAKSSGRSGVAVDKDAVTAFHDLKMKAEYRWIIFKISDDLTTIVTDVKDSGAHCFDEFLGKLNESGEPRYAVYDVHMKTGNTKGKMVFIFWTPDSAEIGKKMVYASSKDNIKRKLVGIGLELQKTEDISSLKEDLVQLALTQMPHDTKDILPELQDECA